MLPTEEDMQRDLVAEFAELMDPCQGVRFTVTLQEWTKEQADSFLESIF